MPGSLRQVYLSEKTGFFCSYISHFLCFTTLTACTLFVSMSFASTLTDYGRLPEVRSMSISPSGNRYTWIQELDEGLHLVVYDAIQEQFIGGANLGGELKARHVSFLSDDFVILRASDSRFIAGFRDKLEYSGAFIYDLKESQIAPMFKGTRNIYPAQEGLGRIVGANINENLVYAPAYDDTLNVNYNLYKIKMKTGRAYLHKRGRPITKDWFVNFQGDVLAQEDFDDKRGRHIFYSYLSGKKKEIYRYDSDLPEFNVLAVAWDEQHLLFSYQDETSDAIYSLSLVDGEISGPSFKKEEKDIDQLLVNNNRKLIAVGYSGFFPEYEFENDTFNQVYQSITHTFNNSSVDVIDTTQNLSKMLIKVSGNSLPGAYYAYDSNHNQLKYLTRSYPSINQDDLGEVVPIKYSARDGLKIPAVLTLPVGTHVKTEHKNLPLVVLPHGGPNSYDSITFDWLSQYLAKLGYLVLQPNFRGSTGFGAKFNEAGWGKWGQEMQDDITDGVKFLTENNIADSNRVCILGASYGGYAALAGGAFTPDLYRCIIAINAVADIPRMVSNSVNRSSFKTAKHYWKNVFGSDKAAKTIMKQVSPVYHADFFTQPTLIIYSKDDTVVEPIQSKKMHKALKRADKNTRLVSLEGEDHWLSTSETRLQTLKLIEEFLTNNNPVK